MSDNGDVRDDLKVPEGELGQKIRSEYENGNDILVSGNSLTRRTRNEMKLLTFLYHLSSCGISFSVHSFESLWRRMCYCLQE